MSDNRPLDEVLDDIRFTLNQVAMRERLSCELSDDELHLIALHGEDAVMDQQDQLNAPRSSWDSDDQRRQPQPSRRSARHPAPGAPSHRAIRSLFSCLSERGARNILNT